MKIASIVGARPQFIKAALVSSALRAPPIDEILIHTGQHYDFSMSEIFFQELGLPTPDHALGIHHAHHGAATGRMIEAIEEKLITLKPDWVLVYGDTNSTLAGALAASKLAIPIAHIESGLRSFNRNMPEEINRVVTDHLSTLLFCPTSTAVKNLGSEGISTSRILLTGDVMRDSAHVFGAWALEHGRMLEGLKLQRKEYVLATCHRAENTDNLVRLREILKALVQISTEKVVVFPVHPRTRSRLSEIRDLDLARIKFIEPLSFIEILEVLQSAYAVLTDSGGLQKEAFFFEIPCLTLREETEWVETCEGDWNRLVGADTERILKSWKLILDHSPRANYEIFGALGAPTRIRKALLDFPHLKDDSAQTIL